MRVKYLILFTLENKSVKSESIFFFTAISSCCFVLIVEISKFDMFPTSQIYNFSVLSHYLYEKNILSV